MRLLIVAATHSEIINTINYYRQVELKIGYPELIKCKFNGSELYFLITGPGINHTAFQLGKYLNINHYDMTINAGVCGSFNQKISLEEIVFVLTEQFEDMGAENDKGFLDMFEMKLFHAENGIFKNGIMINETAIINNSLHSLKKVNGITVNRVHGNELSILRTVSKTNPDVESMEGAAFFYACRQQKIPFYEIRSVSNYVEVRNKLNWNLPLAIENLNSFLIPLIDDLVK